MAYHRSCLDCRRFSQVALLFLVGIADWFPVDASAQGEAVPEVTSITGSSSAAQGLPAAEAALINQRSQETLEVAREASPHTNESSIASFQEQINAAVARATGGRIWDPTAPREPFPRTSWGHPDLGGYWLAVSYVPLERPDELAGKPLYTREEAIAAFARGVFSDASVDPATVHYDWKEWGKILGSQWIWGKSGHPPYGKTYVRSGSEEHPITKNIQSFELEDEVYSNMELEEDTVPLIYAQSETQQVWNPVLWARMVSNGRVIFDALGHDAASLNHPDHAAIICRSVILRSLPIFLVICFDS